MTATLTAAPPRPARWERLVNVAVHTVATAASFAAAAAAWGLTVQTLSSGQDAPTRDLTGALAPLVVLVAVLVLVVVLLSVVLRAELNRPPLARRHLVAPALMIAAGGAGFWPLFAWGLSAQAGYVLTAAALAFQCTVLATELVRGYVHALQRL